jgi:hypothetical protein
MGEDFAVLLKIAVAMLYLRTWAREYDTGGWGDTEGGRAAMAKWEAAGREESKGRGGMVSGSNTAQLRTIAIGRAEGQSIAMTCSPPSPVAPSNGKGSVTIRSKVAADRSDEFVQERTE